MKSLDNFIISLLHPFVIVLKHLYQISFLEVPTHPVLLRLINQHSIALENSTLELSNVKVPIFE